MSRRALTIGLLLSLPATGAILDLASKAARKPAARHAVQIPERAIIDPLDERQLPKLSRAAEAAYTEQDE